MFTRIRKIARMYKSAIQAGLIAGRCKTGCYLDDENQAVVPCIFHREKIARLSESNNA